MDKHTARRVYDTLIYLISCVLSGKPPKAELIGCDVNLIVDVARCHSLSSLAVSALSLLGLATEPLIAERGIAIRKIMLLDAEREAILSELEARKIRYMVLKGVIIKELYPSIGDRQMADNDILFDECNRKAVRDIMLSRGYRVDNYNKGNHDVYLKEPVYNFEMHTALFDSYHFSALSEYFKNALDLASCTQGGYAHYMSDEYYYLYIKAHEYKHYSAGGTGLRSLVDTFVYLNAKKSSLNWEYIEAELSALGMSEYERETRLLAEKIFSFEFAEANMLLYNADKYIDPLSEGERAMLDFFFRSGSYGTTERAVESEMDKEKQGSSRAKYIFTRVFPPMAFYKSNYPFFYKYKILIPFLVIGRVFAMIFRRPRSTARKLKAVMKYKKK